MLSDEDKKRMRQEIVSQFRHRAWVIENDDALWERLSREADKGFSQFIRSRYRNSALMGAFVVLMLAALATVDYRHGEFGLAGILSGAAALNLWMFYRSLNGWADFNRSLSSSEKNRSSGK